MTNEELWHLQCEEAEKALEACHAAFELVPIESIEKGLNWLPSEIALHLLKKAKTSVVDYIHIHGNIDNRI